MVHGTDREKSIEFDTIHIDQFNKDSEGSESNPFVL